jgi:hypothetical protein
LTAATGAEFDDERHQSRREQADAEALQLALPIESAVLGAIGFEAFDDALLVNFAMLNQPFASLPLQPDCNQPGANWGRFERFWA